MLRKERQKEKEVDLKGTGRYFPTVEKAGDIRLSLLKSAKHPDVSVRTCRHKAARK